MNVGDVFTGATIGALDYSQYGGYVLVAQTLGTVQPGNLAPVAADPPGRKHLAIATYNVENLSPNDPQSKFDALARGSFTTWPRRTSWRSKRCRTTTARPATAW